MRGEWVVVSILVVCAQADAEPELSPPGALRLGPQLDLMPSGTVDIKVGPNEASGDLDSAIGIGGVADYSITELVAVGLAPRFVVPVHLTGSDTSGRQLDLRARVTVGGRTSPRLRIHGIVTVGYSAVFHLFAIDNGTSMEYRTTKGLVLGFGGGIEYAIGPRLTLTAEL